MTTGGNSVAMDRNTDGRAVMERGGTGLYVYCVIGDEREACLGSIGLDDRDVYVVGRKGLGALVHGCSAHPYDTEDADVVSGWALAHHRVVDTAWHQWGAVLPMTFNTIVAHSDEGTCLDNLRGWLEAQRAWLSARLEAFRGKAEYGVQVFWDPRIIGKEITRGKPEFQRMEEDLQSKSRGLAHMYRQKLERRLRSEMEARAEDEVKEIHRMLSRRADDVRVEQGKPAAGGHQMLLSLSCLVSAAQVRDLEADVEELNIREGYSARLAGPFPPYSFC